MRQLQGDCLVGTNIRATTALDAGISVNNINIASRDSLYGALADAATTSYTFFGVNFVRRGFAIQLFRIFNVFCRLCYILMSTRLCKPQQPLLYSSLPFSTIYLDIGYNSLYSALNIVFARTAAFCILRVNLIYPLVNFV